MVRKQAKYGWAKRQIHFQYLEAHRRMVDLLCKEFECASLMGRNSAEKVKELKMTGAPSQQDVL